MKTKAPGRGRSRRGRDGDAGFTLVELVVAAGLAALVVASLARGFGSALAGERYSRAATKASAAARGAVEHALGFGYAALAHPPGSLAGDPLVVSGTYDPDGRGALAPEPVAIDAGGLVVPAVVSAKYDGVVFRVHTYVTDAGSALRRVSVLVEWTEGGRAHSTSVSTLVDPVAEDIGAAASVVAGTVGGQGFQSTRVEASSKGGSESRTLPALEPVSGVTAAGGAAIATVSSGPVAHAESTLSTLGVALPGLSLQASGIRVRAESSRAGMTVAGTGAVTVNGIRYIDPDPGTEVRVPGWRVVLNDQRREADGSESVTFVRLESDLGDELTAAWAWVRPAEYLSA